MSGTGDKLRLAIAAFYDAGRLAGSLRDFVLLRLLPDDVWLLTNHERDDGRSTLRRAVEGCGSQFAHQLESTVTAKLIPDAPLIFCTNTPVLDDLRQARTATGGTFLEALFQGEVGEEMKVHVKNGAVIAMVKADTPTLQDQCVRFYSGIRCIRFIRRSAAIRPFNTDAPRNGA